MFQQTIPFTDARRYQCLAANAANPIFVFPFFCDDGHGDYNRSYDQGYEDFDYADYSTGKEDNNFRTQQKKKRKSQKQIIEDILNRWD